MRKKKEFFAGGLLVMLLAVMLFFAFSAEELSEIVPGTEGVYCGTVLDRTMDSIAEERWEWRNDRRYQQDRRSYIVLEGKSFWAAKGYEDAISGSVGDYVEVVYGIEQGTGLLVATRMTVLE